MVKPEILFFLKGVKQLWLVSCVFATGLEEGGCLANSPLPGLGWARRVSRPS